MVSIFNYSSNLPPIKHTKSFFHLNSNKLFKI